MTCDACDGIGRVWVCHPHSRYRVTELPRDAKVVYTPWAKPGAPYELDCPDCAPVLPAYLRRASLSAAIDGMLARGAVLRGPFI